MARILPLIALLFMSQLGFALPILKPGATVQIPPTFTQNYNFDGIVALSNCSGSLVRFETSKPDDFAMVLTNGHCYENGFIKPGQVVVDRPSSRRFSLLSPMGDSIGQVSATKVIYATMTKTDMALYQVGKTYAQIENEFGVHALTLASTLPMLGLGIEVISGYWLRGYTCKVEAIVPELREGPYAWFDAIRYSRPGCEVIGGTSGSPVVATGTRTVVAVNNTGNESGGRCTMNNPCEVDEDGNISYHKGYSYAEQTFWIYGCLTVDNRLDLNMAGCALAK